MKWLLSAAVRQSSNALMITHADLSGEGPLIEFCNKALCDMTGYAEAELLGRSPRMLQGPLTNRKVLDELRACLETGRDFEGVALNYRKNGSTYWLEWNVSPVRDEQGAITHFVSVQRDISARVHAEQELKLLAQALHASNDAVLVTDREFAIVFVNAAFERMSGYSANELLGKTPMATLRSGAHEPAFYDRLNIALDKGEDFRSTFINRHKNGGEYYAEQSIAALRNAEGQLTHYVCIAKDISTMVQRENILKEQAHRDRLTGLLNRHAGESALQRFQVDAQDNQRPYSLVLCDVDFFKQINDRHGHPAGDHVLKLVANVLQESTGSMGEVVRWGGEEFLLIFGKADLSDVMNLAERIRTSVAACDDPAVGHFSISLGVARWLPGENAEDLLLRADCALYRAKHAGRNRVVLDERNA
ncbi:PAS domain S-box protein [Diaphorobacter sp. HDW4B]|uniref:sensor domain-containing diguanylate cyclase n=1 Tax=Diaphorobacter sp. HDW4B TaxID=2714925 RepID=UPI00140AB197|nr:GGDEF domain-containing protein [Diaphorobacter sp. HDW4B]QIL72607.1 PAS domain S-box protein [Diaphorobacter sp. HDW4B]